jgi:zinc transport system substrate-binding protein
MKYEEHKMIKPKQTKILIYLLISVIMITLTGCSAEKQDKSELLSIFVSIEPQKYFADRIGAEYIKVEVMVKSGQNPATYEPSPKQISRIGKANVFFTIGVPFEKAFLKKISSNLPNLLLVDTSEGIEKRMITDHDHEEESENKDHSESEEPDPHIWMSPVLVQKQAETILKTLIKLNPEHSTYFTGNYNKFLSELSEVNLELINILSDLKGSTMFVYHPSFGYFADLYGLKQLAIEEAGKEPSPRIMEKIIKEIIKEKVKIIFVQPEFQSNSIKVITDATGAVVIPINPLSYNYLENLRFIANTIGKNLDNL